MALREKYLLFYCPLCGELALYNGACTNFKEHKEMPSLEQVMMIPEPQPYVGK